MHIFSLSLHKIAIHAKNIHTRAYKYRYTYIYIMYKYICIQVINMNSKILQYPSYEKNNTIEILTINLRISWRNINDISFSVASWQEKKIELSIHYCCFSSNSIFLFLYILYSIRIRNIMRCRTSDLNN